MAEEEKDDEYMVKKKPSLSKEESMSFNKNNKSKSKRPKFSRQESFRYKKLDEDTWRRSKGVHSKARKNLKYRPPKVSIGYRGHSDVRGLHPSGFQEVLVHNLKEIEGLDPERQAIRIAHGVGMKKRIDIEQKADELEIRVLNPS